MTKDDAQKKLKRQYDLIPTISKQAVQENISSPHFTGWKRDTEIAIEKIFGRKSRHISDFLEISFFPPIVSDDCDELIMNCFLDGMRNAQSLLTSMMNEIEEYGLTAETKITSTDAHAMLRGICKRFHLAVQQLRKRHDNRSTLDVADEYDVQDLIHAILLLHFDDVREEEPSPSKAGSASRMDFLLKNERIVVEAKMTRKSLTTKTLGEELIIDISKYATHPNCDTLVCLVYDPEGRIKNPRGIESDLSVKHGKLDVKVFIVP
jgi:hypothetical protein